MSKHLSHPKYRPDIDGLRAIAVLSVVAFHAFPSWVKGGFIGVDIFFVISGYLISTIIFENLDKGTFSFSEFYSRRIRRIFPALLLVLAVSYVLGWFTLLADEYKQLGKHIAGGASFVSNFVLWKESGYFDNAAETKPLLHLWSLGVEEQFYIFYPLALWVAWKNKFNLFTITLFIAIFSFYLNVKGIKHDAIATFFSPQTRFWELMCGSLLAWISLYKKNLAIQFKSVLDKCLSIAIYREPREFDGKTLCNVTAFLGLLLLLYGFFRINKEMPFPGTWALVPVMGSILIISAGQRAWVNRCILSSRIAVWFGLISFPLYLWHWVLLSFPRIIQGELPDRTTRITAVVLSVFLAWLTYKIIERPIRYGRLTGTSTSLLVSILIFFFCLGLVTYKEDGLVSRFSRLAPQSQDKIIKIANAWRFRSYPTPEEAFDDPKFQGLRIGKNDERIILFVGDSHSHHYWNTIPSLISNVKNKSEKDYSVVFKSFDPFPPSFDPHLLFSPQIKKVVFSYYWSYRYKSKSVHQEIRCCGGGKNGSMGVRGPINGVAEMDDLDRTLLSLVKLIRSAGKEVYFILDNPFGEELDPHSMLDRSWTGFYVRPPLLLNRDVALSRTEPVRSRILNIAKQTDSKVIDPFMFLCNEKNCPAFSSEGELLYKDYDHLSLFAAVNKASYLAEIFK